jgi:hypothetical protein
MDRPHYDMDMIRHDDPGEKIIATANLVAVEQGFDEDGGDLRMGEPARARGWIGRRTGAGEAAGDEDDGVIGNPVWEAPVPIHTKITGDKIAGATKKCGQAGDVLS